MADCQSTSPIFSISQSAYHPLPFNLNSPLPYQSVRMNITNMNIPRNTIIEEEGSLSLDEDTFLIQEYGNLDYSDEGVYSDSDLDGDISPSNIHLLQNNSLPHRAQPHRSPNVPPLPKRSNPSKKSPNSMDHSGQSPSTKEESQFLNLQKHKRDSPQQEDIKPQKKRILLEMEQPPSISSSESRRASQDSGQSQGEIQKQFNMESFLNAHPLPLKPASKRPILKEIESAQLGRREEYRNKQKSKSISLITLPEVEERQVEETPKEWRFKAAQFHFMNSFLPESLRVGNKPFALLKYINAKQHMRAI